MPESSALPGRSGGELLVACLGNQGVTTIFGVPGESYLAVLDALHGYDADPGIDFINARNEGGAAFMAEAYGKLTGQPGICFVTRGPGATNASIGVHTARQNSTPMLLFIGQVGTDMGGREAFQEIDYQAYFGSVAKAVIEIDQADRIPELTARAFALAQTGRPGPVVVVLPEDMLTRQTRARPCAKVRRFEAAPDPASVDELRGLLLQAKRPVILAGGGGWTDHGRQHLQAFAEANDLPVVAAFRFQDVVDNHSPNYVGDAGVGMSPAMKSLIKDADVILAIGVRFGEMTTDGYTLLACPAPRQQLIHAHPSAEEIGKIYQPALPIHAGPNRLCDALQEVRLPACPERAAWRAKAREAFEASLDCPAQPGPVDMGIVSKWLRETLPDDFILTNGAGNFTVWPNKFIPFGPRARLLAPQSGAMGYGVPAAITAKLVHPERCVVCFAGDGDFQMNCQELGTAQQFGAQPIILILNNGMYGTIRMHQEREYPAHVSATALTNPDFTALAAAYGFHAERVETTDAFPAAFERARASKTGAVLELNIDPEALTPRQSLSQIRATALAARKVENAP